MDLISDSDLNWLRTVACGDQVAMREILRVAIDQHRERTKLASMARLGDSAELAHTRRKLAELTQYLDKFKGLHVDGSWGAIVRNHKKDPDGVRFLTGPMEAYFDRQNEITLPLLEQIGVKFELRRSTTTRAWLIPLELPQPVLTELALRQQR